MLDRDEEHLEAAFDFGGMPAQWRQPRRWWRTATGVEARSPEA